MELMSNDTDEVIWVEPLDGNNACLVLDEVVGDRVFVRHVDPLDGPPAPVRVLPGQTLHLCTAISHVSINATQEVGADDALYWLRVVPDGRDANVIRGRTLRRGEADDGRRVHLRPGEAFQLAAGALTVELDTVDDFYRSIDPDRPEGSLSAALRVWFSVGSGDVPSSRLIVTAAAHRLDAAAHLLSRARDVRELLRGESVGGPQAVTKIDELIHLTQEGIVALARCIALIRKGRALCAFFVPEDSATAASEEAIKAIRDAYEHIDERALGNLRNNVPDDRAYMIFDHRPLVRDNVIRYLDHELDVGALSVVLAGCRSTIKALAGGPPVPSDS